MVAVVPNRLTADLYPYCWILLSMVECWSYVHEQLNTWKWALYVTFSLVVEITIQKTVAGMYIRIGPHVSLDIPALNHPVHTPAPRATSQAEYPHTTKIYIGMYSPPNWWRDMNARYYSDERRARADARCTAGDAHQPHRITRILQSDRACVMASTTRAIQKPAATSIRYLPAVCHHKSCVEPSFFYWA